MICPILQAGKLANPGFGASRKNDQADCVKEKCAWWHRREEKCAVLALVRSVYDDFPES